MAESRVRPALPTDDADTASGPRSLLLQRSELGFGFTLRHFIVYPPESATLLGGCGGRAMDTIFVKRVASRSPASRAGLETGDRLVSVNGADVGGMTYAAVVQLIQASPARLHLVVVPRQHDILQLYFGETAHNPETNQRSTAIPARQRLSQSHLQQPQPPPLAKPKQRLIGEAGDHGRLSLDETEDRRPIGEQRRASDGNRRLAALAQPGWLKTLAPSSPCSDGGSVDSRNDSLDSRTGLADSLDSRLTDSKDSLSSVESGSTLIDGGGGGGGGDSVIMSRIRRSCEQKEEFLRRPPTAESHAGRLLAREFYARPQKLKPVWPPTSGAEPARLTPPPGDQPPPPSRRDARRGREQRDTGEEPPTPPPTVDDRPGVPAVALVSRRARHFERGPGAGAAAADRTQLYASELARLTSKRANPGVALRRREIERRATRELPQVLETCVDSTTTTTTAATASNQLTALSTRLHCDPPPGTAPLQATPPGAEHAVFAQRVNHASPLRLKTEEAFLRARSNSAESWASAFPAPPRVSMPACDWPVGGASDAEEARHKVVRQDSYLAAVRTPVSADAAAAAAAASPLSLAPPPRPSLLALSPASALAAHPTSSPLTHTSTRQLISALDRAQGEAAGDMPTIVVRRQKNNLQPQTEEERLRRASYLRATNSEQLQLEQEIQQGETEQRNANRKWRPPVFPDDIQQLREFFEEAARPPPPQRCQREPVAPTAEPEKEELPTLRDGWLHCKITVIDGKRWSDRAWKHVWASLQSDRTLVLYKDRPTQQSSSTEPAAAEDSTAVDLRGCVVGAGSASGRNKCALRVNTLGGSELLLQPPDADAELWARALSEDVPGSPVNCISPPAASKSRKLPSFRSRSPTGQSPASKNAKGQSEAAGAGPKAKGEAAGKAAKPGGVAAAAQEPGKPRADGTSSPKSSTWKGRVARQLRRMQGSAPPTSPGAAAGAGATVGGALADCPAAADNALVPALVAKCAAVVEERGLDVVGIYRVPGNTAAVHSLTEAVNKGFMFTNCQEDSRWTDVNVISSLLKLYFRKLPDALLTSELYPLFIEADKMEDPNQRMVVTRRLVRELPDRHYETLKFLCRHLGRVAAHSAANKMEPRNLAIVFGPTLVRTADSDMMTMVTDMSHQCRIVESLLLHVDWFFAADEDEASQPPPPPPPSSTAELEPSAMSHDLLIGNIQKVEGMRGGGGESVLAKVIGSSIISAANRKMQRKPRKSTDEPREVSIDGAVQRHNAELQARQAAEEKEAEAQPADRDRDREADREPAGPDGPADAALDDGHIRTYAGLSATTQERIKRFEQETRAMLQRDTSWPRREPEPVQTTRVTSLTVRTSHESRVSVTNIHVNPLASVENTELAAKRHQLDAAAATTTANASASAAAGNGNGRRESGEVGGLALADIDNGNLKRFKSGNEQGCQPLRLMTSLRCASLDSLHEALDSFERPNGSDGSDDGGCFVAWTRRLLAVNNKLARESRGAGGAGFWSALARLGQPEAQARRNGGGGRPPGARPAAPAPAPAHAAVVVIDPARGGDLLSSLTSTFDRKLKSLLGTNAQTADPPAANASPPASDASIAPSSPASLPSSHVEMSTEASASHSATLPPSSETLPATAALASDPVALISSSEPVAPTTLATSTLSPVTLTSPAAVTSPGPAVAAGKQRSKIPMYRDPSLHRQPAEKDKEAVRRQWLGEEAASPGPHPRLDPPPDGDGSSPSPAPTNPSPAPNNADAVLRANLRPTSKVRRSDSLSKTEKTESNRRRQEKENVKLKRRHGAKDGSIKRRHTVGGTKDLATLPWLDNRWAAAGAGPGDEGRGQGRGLRTSSPDLGRVDWREWGAAEGKAKGGGGVLESHV